MTAVALLAVALVDGDTENVASVTGGGSGIPLASSVEELAESAELIAVGTVTRIHGPEVVLPADPPDRPGPLLVYRVSYSIETVLRGDAAEDLVVVDGIRGGIALFSAEVGERQLLFLSSGALGSSRATAVIPVRDGAEGVFHFTGPTTAENDHGRSLDLGELSTLLPAEAG